MPTPSFFPSNLQWIGAKKETVYGTPQAAPDFWIPVDPGSASWKPDMNTFTDNALRGLMGEEFQQVAGMRSDTLSYKTYPYMDSAYQHFLALWGKPDTVSGAADPWTHKTSLLNASPGQPMSFTLFYIDAAGKCWQIPGSVLESLKTTVKVDELVTLEPSWRGLPAVAITPPANTPSTSKPMPAWNSVISLGGSASSAYSEISLEYKRNTKPLPTINASQSPLAIYGGGVSVAGDITAVYQGSADANLVDFLTNVQPSLSVKVAPAGDAVHSLTAQHSVIAFGNGVQPKGSGDWMEISGPFKALMNATDALDTLQSPGQAIFLTPTSTTF